MQRAVSHHLRARVGILGFTFRENAPDIRNSKVIDIHMELRKLGAEPIVHDPMADPDDLNRAYGIEMEAIDEFAGLSALVLATAACKI